MPDNPTEMRDTLSHRGPDGAGEYHSHNVYLGHRRLSIVDIDTGGQPISNEDGTVILRYIIIRFLGATSKERDTNLRRTATVR